MVEQAQKKQQYRKIDKKRFKAAPLGRMTVVKTFTEFRPPR